VAERVRQELVAGADPDEAAEAAAAEPGGGGGQRGVFGRDDLPPAFAATVFDLPEGGVSDVVEADYGFHLFLVERRLPASAPSLEEAAPEIVERLRSEATDRALRGLVAEAASRYAVEVFDRNLPFAYRGSHPVSRPYENR
jgi:parvulin-like peptidyl-prolyl isomerase